MEIDRVKPYNDKEKKTSQLQRMFDGISRQYDKFNDIMTWGLARSWRKKALQTLLPYRHDQILDIASGTADVAIKAFEHLQPAKVVGIDISEKMLALGREKVEAAELNDKIELQMADVAQIPFKNESFDAVTISFGIRNFEKLQQSLAEIHRVLEKNGKLVILEMSEPQLPIIKQLYLLYTKTLIPFAVSTFSNDKKAYSYLTKSMKAFPQGKQFIDIVEEQGFCKIKYKTFLLGVCSLYLFQKNEK